MLRQIGVTPKLNLIIHTQPVTLWHMPVHRLVTPKPQEELLELALGYGNPALKELNVLLLPAHQLRNDYATPTFVIHCGH
jgi:hypothetical protein